ncbi:winged helix-turn-helix domain-containing protein [Halogranum rubrum]|uniref:winged helix-turn-helix domain-containing protein n=1 Tax=Halogranum rubrum TaxID=553466 RepID=UPI001160168A
MAWTPVLLDRFLEEVFDFTYSIPSCRQLMNGLELGHQKSRQTVAEAKPED